MNVLLAPDLERQVEEHLASGAFASASELVSEALRRFFGDDDAAQAREVELLEAQLQEGLDQLDRGESVPGPEAYRRSREELAAFLAGQEDLSGRRAG